MIFGIQNRQLSFEELHQQAADSIDDFKSCGNAILAALRSSDADVFSDVSFDVGPLKTLDRYMDKVKGDYAGDHSRASDLVRGRYVAKTVGQIDAISTYLENNARELGIEVIKNQFSKPTDTGFRALNTKLRLLNGHVVELRTEHEGLMLAALDTHEPYERIQEIERKADRQGRLLTDAEAIERQILLDTVRDIHSKSAVESGLNDLLSDEGRDKLEMFKQERVVIAGGVARTKEHELPLKDLFSSCASGHRLVGLGSVPMDTPTDPELLDNGNYASSFMPFNR